MSINFHTSTQRGGRARGKELGTALRPQIAATFADYCWLFSAAGIDDALVREVAEASHEALARWSPDLALEVEGIAAGAELPLWQVAAINARTEIVVRGRIAGLKECTSAVWIAPTGRAQALQTWDWIPTVHDFTVRRHVAPGGLGVATFAENGGLAKVGVNSAHVGLLLTLLLHTSDGSRSQGVPIHAVARRVLDEARSLDEAVDIVSSAPVTASGAITLLQQDMGMTRGRVVELAPEGVAVLEPEDGFLLHTNHFLDPALAAGDRLIPIGDDSLPRLARLREIRDVLRTPDRTVAATGLTSHWADGAPICAHPRPDADETDRWETKMTFSLDLETPSLWFHEGGPCGVTEAGWTAVAA